MEHAKLRPMETACGCSTVRGGGGHLKVRAHIKRPPLYRWSKLAAAPQCEGEGEAVSNKVRARLCLRPALDSFHTLVYILLSNVMS